MTRETKIWLLREFLLTGLGRVFIVLEKGKRTHTQKPHLARGSDGIDTAPCCPNRFGTCPRTETRHRAESLLINYTLRTVKRD